MADGTLSGDANGERPELLAAERTIRTTSPVSAPRGYVNATDLAERYLIAAISRGPARSRANRDVGWMDALATRITEPDDARLLTHIVQGHSADDAGGCLTAKATACFRRAPGCTFPDRQIPPAVERDLACPPTKLSPFFIRQRHSGGGASKPAFRASIAVVNPELASAVVTEIGTTLEDLVDLPHETAERALRP